MKKQHLRTCGSNTSTRPISGLHYQNQNPWGYTSGEHVRNASGTLPGPYAVGDRPTPQEIAKRSRNSCDAPGIPPAYAPGTPQERTPQENAERLRNAYRLFPGAFLGRFWGVCRLVFPGAFLGRSRGVPSWGGLRPPRFYAVAARGCRVARGPPFLNRCSWGARDHVAAFRRGPVQLRCSRRPPVSVCHRGEDGQR